MPRNQSIPSLAPASSPSVFGLVPLAAAVVAIGALYVARDVLMPIVLAVLLAFVLAPLVALFRHLRFGRHLSVILATLIALGTIGLTGAVIGQQVAALAPNVPNYTATIQEKMAGLKDSGIGKWPEQISRLASRFQPAPPVRPAPRLTRRAVQPIPVEVHDPPETASQTAIRLLSPIVGPLETFVIVLVVAVFVLLQREDLRDRAIRLFGSSDLHRTTHAIDEAAGRLSRYFLTQLLLNSLFGCVIALGLYWIGIPSPLLWGLLAAILRFVPYVGAFLAALPPLLLAVGAEPGWTFAILTAILFLTAEPVMGYVVEPMVYGHSTGLSPLAVIVAAIFWTWLWGPIGLLLSTPMTLCLVVVGRHVPQLEFIDVLFGDRPALTPVESFYQRMLAGDEEEVHEQAETLLKEMPLSAYYDQVVVGALRLARFDRRRGALTRPALEAIVESTRELIASLDDHEDRSPGVESDADLAPVRSSDTATRDQPPAPRQSGLAVLVVPGPGPIDAAIAGMLVQLLTKHGQRPAVATALDPAPAETPDAVYLISINYRPASLQWRRLESDVRQRWPNARLVRGLLPTDAQDCCASLHDLVMA